MNQAARDTHVGEKDRSRRARRSGVWLCLGLFGSALVGWVLWRETFDESVNLSAAEPSWVLRLTAGAPTRYEALFRIGDRVRLVTGTTPAEWRVEKAALVAQFRSLPAGRWMDLAVRDSEGTSWTNRYPGAHPEKALTHYSTRGRYWIPRIGEAGTRDQDWGARPWLRKRWAPSLEWLPPVDAELRSLPAAEPWPSAEESPPAGR